MSLFTLSGAIHLFTKNNSYFSDLLPGLGLSFMYQVNNLSSIWTFSFILLFFSYLYPIEFNNRKTKLALVSSVCISFLVFIPISVFNSLGLFLLFKAQIIFSGLIIIISLISAFRNKRSLSLLLLMFFVVYWIAMLVEAFLGITSSLFLLLLVTSMFVLVAIKRAETSKVIEEKQELNQRIREVFTRFVPLNILDSLGNSALADRPPGEYSTHDCTMMLLDIRDFTKLSEGLSAEDNFVMINEFYDIVGYEVDHHRGFIESYGGDGVRAIFVDSPHDAVACALAISSKVAESSGIKIGIAVHFGQVIFGTIGSDDRIQATAVSEVSRTLNAMDHFESKMGVEIMLSGTVFSQLGLELNILFLGDIILKGQSDPVALYQVIPPSFQMNADFESLFRDAVRYIEQQDYTAALGCFERAQQLRRSHILTMCYIRQLRDHIAAGDGRFTLRI